MRPLHRLPLTGILILLSSLLNTVSLLPAHAEYRPPANPTAPQGGTSTAGTRDGCLGDLAQADPILLAPEQSLGQTQSPHPTLTWYIPQAIPSTPIELRLYRNLANHQRKLLHRITLPSRSGWTTYQYPLDRPDLTSGHTYRWQLIAPCDPNRPSQTALHSVDFLLQPPIPARSLPQTPIEQARIYAKNGLWYDAIALVVNGTDPATAALRLTLLQDLLNAEPKSPTPQPNDFRSRLQALIQHLRHPETPGPIPGTPSKAQQPTRETEH